MERVVKVVVDKTGGVLPKTPQYAGVQGEHNACRVTFDVTAWEDEPFVYRGEFVAGDGMGGTTAVLAEERGCVSFLLPAAWTAAGGRAVARLVASVTSAEEEIQTVYAVDVPLYFSAKQEYGAAARDEAYAGFTALAETVQAAVETVEEKLASGAFIGPQGERGVSGVYVGGGEMPEGYNLQIDPEGDASMRLAIGRVETLEAEQTATASITGTADAPILNLGLPRGLPGPQGEPGKRAPEWVLIDDRTLTQTVAVYEKELSGAYTEVFIEAVLKIHTTETSAASIMIRDGVDNEFVAVSANVPTVSNGTVIYHRANGSITPDGKYMFDTAAGKAKNTATVSRNCSDPDNHANRVFTKFGKLRVLTSSSTKYQLDAGSTIKIWGR